ncbi:hypothetical protein NBRC116494_06130 [Aurantivibrio plasticivorans]
MTDNKSNQADTHWRYKIIYYCQQDPRLIVRAKIRWLGWSINLAHRTSYLLALALVLAALVPAISALKDNSGPSLHESLMLSLLFVVAILFSAYRVGRKSEN